MERGPALLVLIGFMISSFAPQLRSKLKGLSKTVLFPSSYRSVADGTFAGFIAGNEWSMVVVLPHPHLSTPMQYVQDLMMRRHCFDA